MKGEALHLAVQQAAVQSTSPIPLKWGRDELGGQGAGGELGV